MFVCHVYLYVCIINDYSLYSLSQKKFHSLLLHTLTLHKNYKTITWIPTPSFDFLLWPSTLTYLWQGSSVFKGNVRPAGHAGLAEPVHEPCHSEQDQRYTQVSSCWDSGENCSFFTAAFFSTFFCRIFVIIFHTILWYNIYSDECQITAFFPCLFCDLSNMHHQGNIT